MPRDSTPRVVRFAALTTETAPPVAPTPPSRPTPTLPAKLCAEVPLPVPTVPPILNEPLLPPPPPTDWAKIAEE